MTDDEKTRLAKIAYRSKSGAGLSPEEMRFCSEMFENFPDEYDEAYKVGADRAIAAVNPHASTGLSDDG